MSEKPFRFIILTGPPGCGKTTLVKKVYDVLKEKFALDGFFTEEIRNGRERVGFDVVTLNGKRSVLARVRSDSSKQQKVGKYAVEVKSFESCVLPLLSSESLNSILILDEIGKMELLSPKFEESVRKHINREKGVILATVPVNAPKPMPLVETIKRHPATCLITVDRDNRNALLEKITNLLTRAMEWNLTAQV